MALFSKFFGRTIGEAASFALGGAMRSPLEPPLVELTNETWSKFVDQGVTVPTDPGDAAEIAAERVSDREWAKNQAKQRGYGGEQMDKLINAVLNAPGFAELLSLRRRGLIDADAFLHGLRKARLEDLWDGPLAGLLDVLLTPAELANARQQGYIDQARQYDEAGKQGVANDRAEVQFLSVGLPPGHAEAQHLLNRGLIDAATFDAMIREGHTKTKYTAVLREARVAVLSALQYVEGHLRGWIGEAEMVAGGELTGHTPEQMDFLFKIHGRPISFHQTWIGLQRGGELDGPTDAIHPAFLASLRRSNIQPSFYNLAWAQRYNYPSAFVLRNLAQSGDLTEAQTEQVLKYEGWEPTFAATVAAKWAEVSPAKQDPAIKTAETKFLTALHKAFVGGAITDAQGVTEIALTSLSAEAQAGVLGYWRKEKALEAIPPPPPPP